MAIFHNFFLFSSLAIILPLASNIETINIIETQNTQLSLLNAPTLNNLAQNANQGWIWSAILTDQPYIYYLSSSDPTSPSSVQLSLLTQASSSSFNLENSQGWIWDLNVNSPYIYYLTSNDPLSPVNCQLENLSNGFTGLFNSTVDQGWIVANANSPYIYYLSSADPTHPLNVQLANITDPSSVSNGREINNIWIWQRGTINPYLYYLSTSDPTSPVFTQMSNLTDASRSAFSQQDAEQGWIWDEGVPSPYIYYVTASDPTSPLNTQLTNLTNASNASFSQDASQGWIWDREVASPYIYYLTASDPTSSLNTQLTNLTNATGSSFSQDANQGWIWDREIASPYIYYVTTSDPSSPLNTQLTNLTNATGSSFSQNASQGWIWDRLTANPYIYYITDSNPTTPLNTQLNNLTNAYSSRFSQDAAKGWIWDIEISNPHIYYLTSGDPTSPLNTQLTNLTNAYGSSFSQDANQGWIWDIGVSSPFIYYVSADNPQSPREIQLDHLVNAGGSRFSLNRSRGWIWDIDISEPYVYYISADPTSSIAFNKLSYLNNANNFSFSEDGSYGWIWDVGNSPYIYYLSVDSLPLSHQWVSGIGGIWMNSNINSVLAISKTLEPVFLSYRDISQSPVADSSITLLADAGDIQNENLRCFYSKNPINREAPYSLWLIPFNDFILQKNQKSTPSFTNEITGALGAFDARIGTQGLIGTGFSYTYNRAHYANDVGYANINQELGVLYGSWEGHFFYFNGSCWGGGYQLHSIRKTSGSLTSSSNTTGYMLSTHAELGTENFPKINWLRMQTFLMCDYINNWQKKCDEKGILEMNLLGPSQYGSLLRTEAGIRFYESLIMSWGKLMIMQKGSYIQQTPFYNSSPSPLFIGPQPTFSIDTGSLSSQNLAAIELRCSFLPSNPHTPYITIDLQAELGSKMQSYFSSCQIGKDF